MQDKIIYRALTELRYIMHQPFVCYSPEVYTAVDVWEARGQNTTRYLLHLKSTFLTCDKIFLLFTQHLTIICTMESNTISHKAKVILAVLCCMVIYLKDK